jgi:hypothetical protein
VGRGYYQIKAGAPRAAPSTTAPPRTASYHGVVFVLPEGWTTAPPPQCGPSPDRVVTVGDAAGLASCAPYQASVPTTIRSLDLTSIYGPQRAVAAGSHETIDWHGQPAWLSETDHDGSSVQRLLLPWLNVAATATAPNSTAARALLDQLELPAVENSLDVPQGITSLYILALDRRDQIGGQAHDATITDPSKITVLAADLAELSPITDPAQACDDQWFPTTVLITATATNGDTRTFAARFGDCNQVTSGTGIAAATTAQLQNDLSQTL